MTNPKFQIPLTRRLRFGLNKLYESLNSWDIIIVDQKSLLKDKTSIKYVMRN